MLADPFWPRKITTDPHILAHVNMAVLVKGSKSTKLCLGTDFRKTDVPVHTGSIGNNDLTITKLIDDRFVGAGSFLIRYSNGHSK
jgi:hypothetical protein